MFMTTPTSSTTTRAPRPTSAAGDNPWLHWRPAGLETDEVLSVAELAECRCPDLCDRDHANE